MKDANSNTNQEIKRKFVEREVKACFSYEMEAVLRSNGSDKDYPLPTIDDIENLYVEQCPKCGSDDIYKCTDKKQPNADCFECGGCGVLLPNDELESKPQEIFEWWIVTEFLYHKLKAHNEPVFEWGNNCYWGRCTTGQAILLDGVISEICEEMEILDGQKYSWSDSK